MGVNVKVNYYLNVCMILLFAVCTDQVFAGPQNWNEGKSYAPIQQRQFCDLTEKYRQSLTKAFASNNDIKVNLAKKQRQLDLDALLPRGQFENWVVKVVSVKQVVAPSDPEADGDAAVVLELWCGTQIGTGLLSFRCLIKAKICSSLREQINKSGFLIKSILFIFKISTITQLFQIEIISLNEKTLLKSYINLFLIMLILFINYYLFNLILQSENT